MNIKLFQQNSNSDVACDSIKYANYDLNFMVSGSGTSVSIISNNTNMKLLACFETAVTSSVSSFETSLTSSLNVLDVDGPIRYQFRETFLSGCTALTSSAYSPIYVDAGIKTKSEPLLWLGFNRVRSEIFVQSTTGAWVNLTLGTNNSSSVVAIDPWF